MKKILVLILALFTLLGCTKTPQEEEKLFPQLKEITFEELDGLLESKETFVAYFGWVENCGDSHNIQDNYFEGKLKDHPEWVDQIYVVNLDKIIPEALSDKDLRAPMHEKYSVQYSPTLVYYVDGKLVDLVEWTPLTADPETAIDAEVLDEFFTNAGF